jgi:ComEC/Rec2-related protein
VVTLLVSRAALWRVSGLKIVVTSLFICEVCLLVLHLALRSRRKRDQTGRSGAISLVPLLFAGVLGSLTGLRSFAEERSLKSDKAAASVLYYKEIDLLGEVVSDPEPSLGGERFAVAATAVVLDRTIENIRWRILVRSKSSVRPELGARVRVSGVIAPIDSSRALYYERNHVIAAIRAKVVEIRAPPNRLLASSNWIRQRLEAAVSSALSPTQSALMLGLLIGDDSGLDPSTKQAFREAGMSHLTAVSGQNFAAVLAIASLGFDIARRRHNQARRKIRQGWSRTTVLTGVALFFGLLTRWEPSVLRAGAMTVLGLSAASLRYRMRPIDLLSLCLAILLVVDPFLIDLAGFQLSVAATAGILLSGLRWAKSWATATRRAFGRGILAPITTKLAGGIAGIAAVCTAAQLYVTPILFWRFGAVYPGGVLANFVAVPLAEISSLFGFATAGPAVVGPSFAGRIYAIAGYPLSSLVALAVIFSKFPHLEVTMSETTRGIIAASVCFCIVLFLWVKGRLPLWPPKEIESRRESDEPIDTEGDRRRKTLKTLRAYRSCQGGELRSRGR